MYIHFLKREVANHIYWAAIFTQTKDEPDLIGYIYVGVARVESTPSDLPWWTEFVAKVDRKVGE